MMWSNEISCKCDAPKITRARICAKPWRSWKQTRWSPADVTNPVTCGGLLEYQYVYCIYIYIYVYIYIHTCEIGKQICASIFFTSWSFRFVAVCQPFSDAARSWQYIFCAFVQILFLLEVTAQDLAGRRSFAGDVDSPGREIWEIWEIWDRICQEDIENDQRHFQGFYIDFFL